jgi:hypothetical protein
MGRVPIGDLTGIHPIWLLPMHHHLVLNRRCGGNETGINADEALHPAAILGGF